MMINDHFLTLLFLSIFLLSFLIWVFFMSYASVSRYDVLLFHVVLYVMFCRVDVVSHSPVSP